MTTRKLKTILTTFMTLALLVGCTSAKVVNESIHSTDTNQEQTQAKAVEADSKQASSKANSAKADSNSNQTVEPKLQPTGELAVHFINVGQGASQLIIGPTGKSILIDAGNNDKASIVVDYLKNHKVTKIDILVGTHPDADHVGGLDKVIDSFEIGKIYMPKVQSNTKTFEDVLLAIQRKGLKVSTAKAGLTLDWELDAVVKMIAPISEHSDANDMSAVIHLSFGDKSFLFTGDAESKSEREIIDSKFVLKSDVLLVGHHGSKSSTSQAFLDTVQPTYAVIQVGKSNNYGHPSAEILKRLNDRGIKVYRNDELGDIVFTTNGKDITVR